jgi:hypothetical protein
MWMHRQRFNVKKYVSCGPPDSLHTRTSELMPPTPLYHSLFFLGEHVQLFSLEREITPLASEPAS